MTDRNSDDEDQAEWPTPGVYEPPAWDEYHQLREAVHDYLDHEPDDPKWNDIWRALAAILSAHQRDAFAEAFDLAEPAETACVRRLITGEDECPCLDTRGWTERELEQIGARDDPPHKPPHSDHATLWLDEDSDPVLYSIHVYPGNMMMSPSKTVDPEQQRRNGWMDMCSWAAEWGLEIGFLSKSWYNLGSTVQVVFSPPE